MSRSLFRAVNRGGQAAILRAEKSVLSFSVSSSLLPKTPMRVTSLEPDIVNNVSDEATWGKVFPVYDETTLSVYSRLHFTKRTLKKIKYEIEIVKF